ncbi:alginate export family protein [uncultured Croceitalea sp.]|uniref:alginate export family protein n=1 Tax=uncultured Croceitalea sp. TaxID=1798908 RepID=UPI0033057ECE
MKFWIFIGLLFCFASLNAQDESNTYDFSLLRQNDEINIDRDAPKNFYQNIKEINLSDKTILSFGGSYRFQTEGFVNEQFSSEEDQNDFWFLNRFQLYSHLKVSDKFELFAELNSSLIASKEEISPVEKDELSFNQFFVRYHFHPRWNVLVGRQNMRLGSGRLIDIREGPNVRLSFDMAQLQYNNSKTRITGFYAVPVQLKEGVFDNDMLDFKESVSALYWTQNWNTNTNTDIYALYKKEENKTWNLGTADDNRLSIGLRHFGTWKKFTFNNEFVFQTGSFGDQSIRAWTASFNVEHPLGILGDDGIIGIKTEAISGDSSNSDSTLNTFDGLYPRGAYFGRVARFGPSNLIDIHPYINTSIGAFSIELDYVAFWRFSRQDGVYSPPLILEYPSTNNDRFIGHQIGTIGGIEINDFINLELETNLIFPGNFLSESSLDDTLFHTVLTAEIKF